MVSRRITIYMSDEDAKIWDAFAEYCKAMKKSASKMVRDYAREEVSRFRGLDPQVVTIAQQETLEAEYEKSVREIESRYALLSKQRIGDSNASEILSSFVFNELGLKEDQSNLSSVLQRLYGLRIKDNSFLTAKEIKPSQLELYIQLLKRVQKRMELHDQIVESRGSKGKKKLEAIESKAKDEIKEAECESEESLSESQNLEEPNTNQLENIED